MSVSEETVLSEIKRVVEGELKLAAAITPQSRLVEDLGLDSLTMTTLAVELEDRFRVILSDDAASLRTVSELAKYVAERAGASS